MKRSGPQYQKGDEFFPKRPIPVDGMPGDYIYPTDGKVVVDANLGKEHHKTIVVVVDLQGRRSKIIKAQLFLAKHSKA